MPATASTTRREMSWAVSPRSASTSGRRPWSRNCVGIPKSSSGVRTPPSRSAWAHDGADTADPDAVLDGDDQPVPRRQGEHLVGQRLDPARVDDGDADALVGQPLATSRRGAAIAPTDDDEDVLVTGAVQHVHAAPAFERGEVGGHGALREAQRRSARRRRRRPRAAPRAASRRRAARPAAGPGTTCRIAMSHMPWWQAPSGRP